MVLFVEAIPGLDLFEVVLFFVEYSAYLIALNVLLYTIAKKPYKNWVLCMLPLALVISMSVVIITSYEHAMRRGYDLTKPTIREALENYIETGEGDLDHIVESNEFPPVFGQFEVKYLIKDLMSTTLLHLDSHNAEHIPISYNKENDWFEHTLGEPMIYTSAIFKQGNESLNEAQKYKLDYVAQAIDLKPGDRVLDIGCGWGTLVEYFSKEYGANVVGVTLSSEQMKYFKSHKQKNIPKNIDSKVLLQDAMQMLNNPEIKKIGKFDKIVSLEMMEHVGIRRYMQFLEIVQTLLKDDGVFYMQVAGLRRAWRFDDFVWGLFMGEHIFPGADASTPIGWVSTHVERAGFEVQRVNNLGSHYSRTLELWLEEWHKGKDKLVAKYGSPAYRRWEVFLRWAVTTSRIGRSTVFMITTTKQNTEARVAAQKRLVPVW